jgi:hypothetical protein
MEFSMCPTVSQFFFFFLFLTGGFYQKLLDSSDAQLCWSIIKPSRLRTINGIFPCASHCRSLTCISLFPFWSKSNKPEKNSVSNFVYYIIDCTISSLTFSDTNQSDWNIWLSMLYHKRLVPSPYSSERNSLCIKSISVQTEQPRSCSLPVQPNWFLFLHALILKREHIPPKLLYLSTRLQDVEPWRLQLGKYEEVSHWNSVTISFPEKTEQKNPLFCVPCRKCIKVTSNGGVSVHPRVSCPKVY